MRVTRAFAYSRPPPVPKMPDGLVELMEGLTRDVLQHSPPDQQLHEFCATHMEQLLLIRDGRAPMKKRAPLEQRIKKAQEKIREKAEQRRRKYDEELQKHNQEVTEAMSSSKATEETIQESSKEEENLKHEEAENSTEANVEHKLKAPVHHERDLTKASEVEIFHKSVDGSTYLLDDITEVQNLQEKTQEQAMSLEKNTNNESAEIKTAELEETLRVTLSDEENTASEDDVVKDNAIEHVRERRSIGTDIADEPKEPDNAKNEVFIDSKELKYIDEHTEDKASCNSTQGIFAEVTDNDMMTSTSTVEDNIDSEQEIDKTTVFANEVPESVPTPEAINIDQADVNIKDNSPVFEYNAEAQLQRVEDRSDVTLDGSIELSKTVENYVNDTVPADKNEDIDEKTNISETVPVTSNNTIENTVNVTQNIPSKEMTDVEANTTKHKKNNNKTLKNENEVEAKSDITTETSETTREINDTLIPVEEDEGKIDHKKSLDENTGSNGNECPKDYVSNDSAIIQESETLGVKNHNEIIETSLQPEVLTEPIDLKQSNKQKDSHELKPDESGDNEHIAKMPVKEAATQECTLGGGPDAEENSDGSLTTVDKILVDEPAGGNDDNNSAPEQTNTENTIENKFYMNGNREIIEENTRNGSKSPEPERIPSEEVMNQEVSKEIQNQDDSTTTSEPLKTDPETSSMGKSSSMDESLIEEGVDILTEVDVLKSDAGIVQNKETPSSMDLETAAVTIQKVFRTFLFKSRGSTFEDTCESGSIDGDGEKTEVEFPVTASPLKERRTLGISRMDTVLQTVNEEKSLSLSTDDSSLSSAATIIQAHVRGFLLRNRLNSNKTNSSTSLVNSDGPSTSLENDPEQKTNKTILNIHIVPEGEHFLSRDESLLTSMELSLDGSPPSSTNLHPLGYDKSQPRKQLKREDAIQSISPPSNNSGKLSEDVDSVKDMLISDLDQQKKFDVDSLTTNPADLDNRDDTPTKSTTIETVIQAHKLTKESSSTESERKDEETAVRQKGSLTKLSSDESDVVTPYEDKSMTDSDATSHLIHSGEFHDIVLPTKVSRGDTSVVRGE